jgi:hypothetical protein
MLQTNDLNEIILSDLGIQGLVPSTDFAELPVRRKNKDNPNLILQLQHNFLEEIPPVFLEASGLLSSQLTELNLSRNRLTCLPDEIGNLTQLRELHLSFNQIQSLPVSMEKLSNLEVLDISHNRIRYIPAEILCALPNLRQFFTTHNLFNIMDTRHNKQVKITNLRHMSMQIVAKELELDPHSYCDHGPVGDESLEEDDLCPPIPSHLLDGIEILRCSYCRSKIYWTSGDPVLKHLSVILRCNQPVVARSTFCSQSHRQSFLKAPRSFNM